MTFLILELLFTISLSKEIKERQIILEDCQKPEGFDSILDNSELYENKKIYSCQQEFTNQINIKNCVLTMISCTFSSVELPSEKYGIVYINVENFPAELTGNIEIKSTTFNGCDGGCIYYISSDETKSILIKECLFKLCKISQGDITAIKIEASSGEINTCQFIKNSASGFGKGIIFYNQPNVGDKDIKLTITKSIFEHTDPDTSGLIIINNDNSKLEVTENQFKIADSVEYMTIFYSPNDLTQFQNWVIKDNCMTTLRKDIIMGSDLTQEQQLIVDSFDECPDMECPPIPDPNSNLYVSLCDTTYDESTHNQEDTLVAFYYCIFKSITNFDTGIGGGVYISTSDKLNKDIKLPLKIYNCEFSYCSSSKGGAIAIKSTETSRLFEIKDCTFSQNRCMFSETDTYSDESYGGCIYINARLSSILISDSGFDTSEAGNGAAISYVTDSTSVSSARSILEADGEIEYSLRVTGCTFSQNTATNNGGAIHVSLMNDVPTKPIEITKCKFTENKAEEYDALPDLEEEVLPESGGAIYYVSNQQSAIAANFAFVIKECDFIRNQCSHLGGAICLLIMNNEPSKPIEINQCTFDKNAADPLNGDLESYGADIYYSFNTTTATSSKTLLEETNPSLNVIDCDFSNGKVKTKGSSLYFTVQDIQTSRPIEVTKCTFKGSVDSIDNAINILSNRPNVLFHFSQCEFSGKCSVYFNAISGQFDFCSFNDIAETDAIHYDCNPDVQSNGQQFKIEYCNFTQNNEVTALVFVVPKSTSNFAFSHNIIKIANTVTRVFDCNADAQKDGQWQFENNSISPPKEEYIKTENAKNIQFDASCENGFLCEFSGICTGSKRCYANGNDLGISYVLIINTEFSGFEHPTNGGAVELINYGLICNTTKFISCKSQQGGGGIYIHVDKELNDPISLKKVHFTGCEAVYGGGAYIYSSVETNVIEVYKCEFISNIASKTKTDDELYGCGAVYMRATNAKIVGCKFSKNTGNGVKFYNVFASTQSSLSIKNSDEQSSSISVDNCVFEMNEESSSSIYYVHSNNKEVAVNIKRCIFKGQLQKNAYHIDGTSLTKNDDAPKLKIESCKFSSNRKSALNLNSNLAIFDVKSQEFNFNDSLENESQHVYNWKLISGLIMTVIGVVVVAVIAIFAKYNKSTNNNNQEQTSEEILGI